MVKEWIVEVQGIDLSKIPFLFGYHGIHSRYRAIQRGNKEDEGMSQEITYVCINKTKHHSYSDVFGSREIAKYVIGRPDGSPMKLYNIGELEAISLVTHLPAELLEVVKDHYGFTEDESKKVFNPKELSPEVLDVIKHHYGLVEIIKVDEAINSEGNTEEELKVLLTESGFDAVVIPEGMDENIDIDSLDLEGLRHIAKGLDIKNYHVKGEDRLRKEINAVLDASGDDSE